MSTTLDMERIAKELGAERRGKVSAHGGYFGALQLAAEVAASRFRVPEGPPSPNEILKEDNLMYDDEARQKLLDKLDYELWLLNELTEYQIFDGGTDITTFKIRSGEPRAEVILGFWGRILYPAPLNHRHDLSRVYGHLQDIRYDLRMDTRRKS